MVDDLFGRISDCELAGNYVNFRRSPPRRSPYASTPREFYSGIAGRNAKDILRANFAMSMSRQERIVEELKFRVTIQLSEIGQKTAASSLLKAKLVRKSAMVDELAPQIDHFIQNTQAAGHKLESNEGASAAKEVELVQSVGKLAAHTSAYAADPVKIANPAASISCELCSVGFISRS